VFACLDARMREVYVAALEGEGPRWSEILAPEVCKPDEVTLPEGEWFGAGDGLARYPDVAGRLRLRAHDATLLPTAASVGAIAVPVLAAGGGVAPEEALPRYVRHRVALTAAQRAAGERL